jgi:hypothetical protein
MVLVLGLNKHPDSVLEQITDAVNVRERTLEAISSKYKIEIKFLKSYFFDFIKEAKERNFSCIEYARKNPVQFYLTHIKQTRYAADKLEDLLKNGK